MTIMTPASLSHSSPFVETTPVQRKAYVVRRALYLIHNSKQTSTQFFIRNVETTTTHNNNLQNTF